MALDIRALRAKLDSFKGQDSRTEAFWKPADGKSVVRIVPWAQRPDNPFIELYFHYLGNRTYLSPVTNGNRDPIAEFADRLRAEGTREAYSQARDFMPKLRTFVPVIVRGEEEQGVRYWSFGKTVYQELLSYIADPDYGDITDITTGRDVVVEYIPQEKSDTSFAKTMVRPKPNQTPLSTDTNLVSTWTSNQPNIQMLFKEPSYEELSAFLKRYLDPEAEDESAASVTQETITPPNTKTRGTNSTVEDFEALFSE